MSRTIVNRIGTVFVPVRNIEKARDWYCRLLNIPAHGEIQFGHLYCVPMEGDAGLVLDSRIFDAESRRNGPLFHFNTDDIVAAYHDLKQKDVELLTGIENDHWFTFRDPDGNVLMVCKC
ncbi:VOC family protein [Brevibacillus ruminantium]|uniref:VOC family protein n=1 Tax=Brevibacillus ruminantium TaxID=2950604 RepID=A0ABY4WKT3_9BACL|nr:VOC family protein [Brevibacillus ruminantium]USG67755.1 VOC family protein [Brevibacillus ruminantium]